MTFNGFVLNYSDNEAHKKSSNNEYFCRKIKP